MFARNERKKRSWQIGADLCAVGTVLGCASLLHAQSCEFFGGSERAYPVKSAGIAGKLATSYDLRVNERSVSPSTLITLEATKKTVYRPSEHDKKGEAYAGRVVLH